MTKEQSITRLFVVAAGAALALTAMLFVAQSPAVAHLTQQFGIPAGAGAVVLNMIEGGSWVATIIGFLFGLGTGGVGLIAAAGREALMAFLRKELRRRGRRAFIAW